MVHKYEIRDCDIPPKVITITDEQKEWFTKQQKTWSELMNGLQDDSDALSKDINEKSNVTLLLYWEHADKTCNNAIQEKWSNDIQKLQGELRELMNSADKDNYARVKDLTDSYYFTLFLYWKHRDEKYNNTAQKEYSDIIQKQQDELCKIAIDNKLMLGALSTYYSRNNLSHPFITKIILDHKDCTWGTLVGDDKELNPKLAEFITEKEEELASIGW
jgi:hypothetical protein